MAKHKGGLIDGQVPAGDLRDAAMRVERLRLSFPPHSAQRRECRLIIESLQITLESILAANKRLTLDRTVIDVAELTEAKITPRFRSDVAREIKQINRGAR